MHQKAFETQKKNLRKKERERNREKKGHSFHEKSLKKVATS